MKDMENVDLQRKLRKIDVLRLMREGLSGPHTKAQEVLFQPDALFSGRPAVVWRVLVTSLKIRR